jgi:hypothetical protein
MRVCRVTHSTQDRVIFLLINYLYIFREISDLNLSKLMDRELSIRCLWVSFKSFCVVPGT